MKHGRVSKDDFPDFLELMVEGPHLVTHLVELFLEALDHTEVTGNLARTGYRFNEVHAAMHGPRVVGFSGGPDNLHKSLPVLIRYQDDLVAGTGQLKGLHDPDTGFKGRGAPAKLNVIDRLLDNLSEGQ